MNDYIESLRKNHDELRDIVFEHINFNSCDFLSSSFTKKYGRNINKEDVTCVIEYYDDKCVYLHCKILAFGMTVYIAIDKFKRS